MSKFDSVILGGGAIGVCTAIALQKAGQSVTLIEQSQPGQGTSYGNAGLISRNSVMPLNAPKLLSSLPQLLLNRSPGFRYQPTYLARNLGWAIKFIAHCTVNDTRRRAQALNTLIARSVELYPALLREAGIGHRLTKTGWLKLFRTSLPDLTGFEFELLKESGVRFDVFDRKATQDLEPSLHDIYEGSVLFTDTASLNDPGATIADLANHFTDLGGTIIHGKATNAETVGEAWVVRLESGDTIETDHIVVALGPWSRDWLKRLGIKLPLAYERGAHREFEPGPIPLNRPIHDVDGYFILAPMDGRWRLTCGVELAERDAPRSSDQLDLAEAHLREAVQIGTRLNKPDWLGARPTLPDSLPAIGPLKQKGLWLATGHQHIGMTMAASTAEMLAGLMLKRQTPVATEPFLPSRFGI